MGRQISRRRFLADAAALSGASALGLPALAAVADGMKAGDETGKKGEIEKRVEKLRQVRISRKAAELFRRGYSHERESLFLLFQNDRAGVLDVVVRGEGRTTKGGAFISEEQIRHYQGVLKKFGYSFVGFYHSHTHTDEKIKEIRSVKGYEDYTPKMLSGDDQGAVVPEDRIKLLGHQSAALGWSLRGFTVLNPGDEWVWKNSGEDTRFLIENAEYLGGRGYIVDHYLGYTNMELTLEAVDSTPEANVVQALGKNPYYRDTSYRVASPQVEALYKHFGFIPGGYDGREDEYTEDERGRKPWRWVLREYATGKQRTTLMQGDDFFLEVESEAGKIKDIAVCKPYMSHMRTTYTPQDLQQLRDNMPKQVFEKIASKH